MWTLLPVFNALGKEESTASFWGLCKSYRQLWHAT